MSTAQTQSALPPAFGNNGCVDPADMEAYLDFNQMASPADKGKGRMMHTPPTLASPANAMPFFDLPEEHHTPLQPSHDYGQYKQQIGVSMQQQSMYTGYNTGMFDTSMFGESSVALSQPSDMDSFLNFSQDQDIVDPSFLLREEAQAPLRYYPGMHQQQAEMQKKMHMAQKQREAAEQQRAEAARRSASQQPMDNLREDTISRVMNEMRRNSSISEAMSPPSMSQGFKIKRDDDDMDEDERLLNSEEGKKLSSKERRQLRNKVSARAFRSRRKEYISQLEGQVANKVNDANALKRENQMLKADNQSLRHLAETLISHPAFMPFMQELSRDPALAESLARVSNGPPATTATDASPKEVSFAQNDVIVGMTLIPEMPVDLSSLNIGSNQWQLPRGIESYQTPQIFAVTEVVPAAEPLDMAALSGKETEDVVSQYMETEKTSYPEAAAPAQVESDNLYDENDPCETLYAAAPVSQPEELIFGELSIEKAFARVELVEAVEIDEDVFESELLSRFSRVEASCRNMQRLTARYQ